MPLAPSPPGAGFCARFGGPDGETDVRRLRGPLRGELVTAFALHRLPPSCPRGGKKDGRRILLWATGGASLSYSGWRGAPVPGIVSGPAAGYRSYHRRGLRRVDQDQAKPYPLLNGADLHRREEQCLKNCASPHHTK
ncbi:hypothetical protein NDU88_002715 [Pleurodeles waltl]|uniref:Uncharacterized protein n=1 Tax=Pleurodeles waltl TaxID=8319 RepID=A0AAV7M2B9_PLEWA|nr:hypothetical protein NDU88_002715 [Pleurodeles waltl]